MDKRWLIAAQIGCSLLACTLVEDADTQPESELDASVDAAASDARVQTLDARDPCRSSCSLDDGNCRELDAGAIEGYEETLSTWRGRCSDGGRAFPNLVSGRCADGKRALMLATGYTRERRYFDDAGAFTGVTTTSDAVDPVCGGNKYWPTPISCVQLTVTEVHCGSVFAIGDDF